jgi:hypothetical protein
MTTVVALFVALASLSSSRSRLVVAGALFHSIVVTFVVVLNTGTVHA